jgi:hypothetical protein
MQGLLPLRCAALRCAALRCAALRAPDYLKATSMHQQSTNRKRPRFKIWG